MSVPIGFKDAAEYEAWKRELHGAKEQLRELATKAERARAAETAGEAFDVAEGFGAVVPTAIRVALGAALFFLPTLRLLPFGKDAAGVAARRALDVVIESIELMGRVFDVKGR